MGSCSSVAANNPSAVKEPIADKNGQSAQENPFANQPQNNPPANFGPQDSNAQQNNTLPQNNVNAGPQVHQQGITSQQPGMNAEQSSELSSQQPAVKVVKIGMKTKLVAQEKEEAVKEEAPAFEQPTQPQINEIEQKKVENTQPTHVVEEKSNFIAEKPLQVKEEAAFGFGNEQPIETKQQETKPATEENEDMNFGEQAPGLGFFVGMVSGKTKSVGVNSGEAKLNLEDTEKRLRANNTHLSHIRIGFDPEETENVDWFITKIFSTSAFTRINLTFEKQGIFSDDALKACGQSLAKLSLQDFIFENWGEDSTDQFFAHIKPGFVNQKGMKHLSFSNYTSTQVTDGAFEHIREMIEGMNGLQELELIFEGSAHITTKALITLKETLKSKKALKSLWINFSRAQKLSDDFLGIVEEIVKALPALETFKLFIQDTKLSPEAVEAFSNTANGMKLKEFYIEK